MNYKIKTTLEKNRKNLMIYGIVWVLVSILFVMPMSYSIVNATIEGSFQMNVFFQEYFEAISKLFEVFTKTFTEQYLASFFGIQWKFTIIYLIFIIIGLVKTSPKNEYTDIEHGSSDWSKNGEQYRVLSDKKGLILAENNYLPLDKRGNINVLVVGRFWIW